MCEAKPTHLLCRRGRRSGARRSDGGRLVMTLYDTRMRIAPENVLTLHLPATATALRRASTESATTRPPAATELPANSGFFAPVVPAVSTFESQRNRLPQLSLTSRRKFANSRRVPRRTVGRSPRGLRYDYSRAKVRS